MTKLKYTLPALGDIGLGLITAVIISLSFDTTLSLLFIAWCLLWAFLPDIDGILHLNKTGRFLADTQSGTDHRDGLHYPLLWLFAFAVTLYFFELNIWLAAAMFGVFVHFIHDMIGIGWGIKCLAPFDQGSYKLFSKKWISADVSLYPVVIRYSKAELKNAISKHGEPDWIKKYFCKLTHISITDYSLFTLGFLLTVYSWLV